MCPTAPGQPLPPYTPSTPDAPEEVSVSNLQGVVFSGFDTPADANGVFYLDYFTDTDDVRTWAREDGYELKHHLLSGGYWITQPSDSGTIANAYGVAVGTDPWDATAEWETTGLSTSGSGITAAPRIPVPAAPQTVAPSAPGNAPTAPGAALGSGPGNAPAAPGSVTPDSPPPPAIPSDFYSKTEIKARDAAVNVMDYGAAGDGTTDDTAAIQEALDTGRAVFFPNGTYKISDWLVVECNGRVISGESMTRTIISQTSTTKGVFSVEQNDAASYPNNPPGGSAMQSLFPVIENFTLQAATASSGSGVRTVVSTDQGAPTWAGDGLELRNLWAQNFSSSGGKGFDIVSISKFYGHRLLAKNCETGGKFSGSGLRCPNVRGFSASGCVIHLDLADVIAGYFELSDFAVSAPAATTHHIRATTTTATIVGGEIEGAATFIEATTSDITLIGSNLLVSNLATPPIIANANCDIVLINVDRQGHVAGTPMGKATANTGRIYGFSGKDFFGADLSSATNNANALQILDWASGDPVARIGPFPYTDPTQWTTPTANMVGVVFATPINGVGYPGGDLRTVVQDNHTNQGTGTQYRWCSLTRPNFSTFQATSTVGGAHYGAPDLVILNHASVQIDFPLLASSSAEYQAAKRGGYLMIIKNPSVISHTVVPNGTDTIDGVNAAITLAAGESVRLFTLGSGAWLKL